jgi:Trypsin-like peptidase domain
MAKVELVTNDRKIIFETLASSYNPFQLANLTQNVVPTIYGSIPWMAPLDHVVSELITGANQRGVLDALLLGAAEENPFRPDLRELVLRLSSRKGWGESLTDRAAWHDGFSAHGLKQSGLEALTSGSNPFVDIARLSRWMLGVERHVCKVYCKGEQGTGFLVGPDLVLTNHHVVVGHLSGGVTAADVGVRFDFHVSPAGVAPQDNTAYYAVDATWQIPNRPHSKADKPSQLGVDLPANDELDFALLKLQKPAGSETVNGGPVRGWVDVSADVPVPKQDDPILIVGHPGQPPSGIVPLQPLKITFATPGFQKENSNHTRVSYTPSTLPGSSGSPVFGPQLSCVALHHNAGDLFPGAPFHENNRGIPIKTIRSWLASNRKDAFDMLIAPPAVA